MQWTLTYRPTNGRPRGHSAPLNPPKPPKGWQTQVLKKGRKWLNLSSANRGAKSPRPYWLKYRDEIGEKFDYICCYTAVYVANGQADHHIPWAAVRGTRNAHQADQWSNIRYADGWINSAKGSARLPDPFVVQNGWFELLLPSLELQATGRHPPTEQQAVDNLLKLVGKDHRAMKVRNRYFDQYRKGKRPFELVDEDAPLLARPPQELYLLASPRSGPTPCRHLVVISPRTSTSPTSTRARWCRSAKATGWSTG